MPSWPRHPAPSLVTRGRRRLARSACDPHEVENRALSELCHLQRKSTLTTEEKLTNLRELDAFVLDNSLRETTVASVYGHTIEGKYKILEAVRRAGMKHLIVGAFGPTRRVDEG